MRRSVLLAFVLTGCAVATTGSETSPGEPGSTEVVADHSEGRLGARPSTDLDGEAPTGTLDLPGPDEGLLFVPDRYRARRPAPLVISLHGCCGEAAGGLGLVRDAAERVGAIVVAPEGTGGSWDVIGGGFGPDVEVIDAALGEVFATYAVDPERVAIAGFSDGASYALSLGLTNGDLFTHVIAHSPGFMAPGERHGTPAVFVAHGREDRTLPFENAEDIVAELRDDGHRVVFRPFDAGHKRQPQIFAAAMRWFASG